MWCLRLFWSNRGSKRTFMNTLTSFHIHQSKQWILNILISSISHKMGIPIMMRWILGITIRANKRITIQNWSIYQTLMFKYSAVKRSLINRSLGSWLARSRSRLSLIWKVNHSIWSSKGNYKSINGVEVFMALFMNMEILHFVKRNL